MGNWPDGGSKIARRSSSPAEGYPGIASDLIPRRANLTSDSTQSRPDFANCESDDDCLLINSDWPVDADEPAPGVISSLEHPSLTPSRHAFDLAIGRDILYSRSAASQIPSSLAQSDGTETKVPGSSPENPIDMSDTDTQLRQACVSSETSTVRRKASPQSIVDKAVYEGVTVHLSDTVRLLDNTYLRIERINRRGGVFFFYGRRLLRTNDNRCPPYIPRDEKELIWMPRMDHDNGPSQEIQDAISLDEVDGLCKVVFINLRRGKNEQNAPGSGLVCRLKVTTRKRSTISNHRRTGLCPNTTLETIVEYLTSDECDGELGFTSNELRDMSRGLATVPFGAGKVPYRELPTLDHDGSPPVVDFTTEGRAYTFGDAYCGAGGTSCGAQQAGLRVLWACDLDKQATETYALNFTDVDIWRCQFHDFLTNSRQYSQVDIAHCSPPCQTWSPAHTMTSKQDDDNSACVFSAGNLLDHARPRILTMEETAGLAERYKEVFYRVIMDLIEAGYSVRWAVLDVLQYGVPQTRKRLIIFAAGPGETLPKFPEPTHDLPGSGCLPVQTIEDVIKDIPLGAPNHEEEEIQELLDRWQRNGHKAEYDGRMPAKTLTCSGGEANYHPSGKRAFSCREVACLQTFPMDFMFSTSGVRKQIGNAVPPILAKALYVAIVESLKATDARELNERAERERAA
ncbi:uncharacterized protein N7482_005100 [Penicillium canariense]|uniref:DNA (cytosine-5-)-methyltransferase n=1 Tax=Penicillium canariense TaxID=189055 RepID=A0A9W9I1R6_9EURO|nr:uncharacterized protein N7482_005100 [Penicillium canariense]KAJ5166319.1 hypothetical protein N7482_005100 [Penicillium canariense]